MTTHAYEAYRCAGSRRPAPTVSVVISAYSTERWTMLRAAVASSLAESPHEVIVVIDHNDALLTLARTELVGVRVVANQEARGLSGARNTGLRNSSGTIVAFVDDDAEVCPGWLAALSEPFADPRVVGAGGTVAPRWQEPPPAWLPAEFYWVIGCSYLGLPGHGREIRNPIGANMAFRRDAALRVGGFPHGIGRIGTRPLGCEETECAIRMLREHPGTVILQVTRATVRHWVPPERATWAYFRSRCWSEGLSKAAITATVGAVKGLASERSYIARTLPRGFGLAIADAAHGDRAGLARAAAIVSGLAITAAGYAFGRVRVSSARPSCDA